MHNVLGPRNLKGILGETFKICGRNFLRLLALVASVQVPLMIAIFGITSQVPSIIGLIGARLLFTVAQAFFWGAVIHAVSEQYLRQTVGIGRAYRFAWGRLWPLTGVLILIFLVGALVTMLSNIHPLLAAVSFCVAMYFMVHWACALQAASLEGLGPIAAISRSSHLVNGNWGRVLGLFLVVLMILFVIFGVSNIFVVKVLLPMAFKAIPLSRMAITAFSTLSMVITAIPVTLIGGIGYTLLYYDLRVRKEGYSLESLAKEVHIRIEDDSHEKR